MDLYRDLDGDKKKLLGRKQYIVVIPLKKKTSETSSGFDDMDK